MFSLRSLRSNRRIPSERKAAPSAPPRFRPQLEGFEDRTVPAAPVMGPALAAPAVAAPASLLPINITSVAFNPVNNVLSVVGTIGNQVFSTTGTLTPGTNGTTPILDLHLNAIHLNVLGLTVDTSNICLNISADPNGGLLGSLLSNVANLLNTPTNTSLLGTVNGQLSNLLNNVLGQLGSPGNVAGAGTNILHLSLGPVHLDVLGLNVDLDNCANGPVTVDIGAQAGPGQLLGNLLTSVSHLLDSPAAGNALTNALNRVAGAINNLLH